MYVICVFMYTHVPATPHPIDRPPNHTHKQPPTAKGKEEEDDDDAGVEAWGPAADKGWPALVAAVRKVRKKEARGSWVAGWCVLVLRVRTARRPFFK